MVEGKKIIQIRSIITSDINKGFSNPNKWQQKLIEIIIAIYYNWWICINYFQI